MSLHICVQWHEANNGTQRLPGIATATEIHYFVKSHVANKDAFDDIIEGKGELGTAVKEVEEKLGMTLEVAAKWDAVLLLDEADVFLEKRERAAARD
ncbi:putative aaa family atpase protein [Eutypa lata UCREL1]|uniref:Putative aaa family atpase protein n=1 Tax=Eutypa lata (strain UCR-EL1) TaxID=1287681 RepID=M7TMQ3_EUTLA|nr:putative aaa family atpase protein [Eutypa lata UCREL1]